MNSNQIRRKSALEHYLENPNYCRECNSVILVPDGVKVSYVRIKQFCNRTCANTYNNRKFPKRRKKRIGKRIRDSSYRLKPSICETCGKETMSREGRRKFCESCFKLYKFPGGIPFPDVTKKDLFERRSNWQSARNSIRSHAQRVFAQSEKPLQCEVCGYSLHVEIAHRISVSEFSDSAKMKEINDLSNLVAHLIE